VCENRMLKAIFRIKKQDAARGWKKWLSLWIHLVQNKDWWRALVNSNETSDLKKSDLY
jgi:hypothetical protein